MFGGERFVFAILAGLSGIAASSFPAEAQDANTLTYRWVANGPTIVLRDWTCWFGAADGCKYAPCHMTTAQEPTLGKLTPKVSPGVIPANGGSCAGRPVPVLNIKYTPKRGAHGDDQIVLQSNSENGFHHTIYIHVQVP